MSPLFSPTPMTSRLPVAKRSRRVYASAGSLMEPTLTPLSATSRRIVGASSMGIVSQKVRGVPPYTKHISGKFVGKQKISSQERNKSRNLHKKFESRSRHFLFPEESSLVRLPLSPWPLYVDVRGEGAANPLQGWEKQEVVSPPVLL